MKQLSQTIVALTVTTVFAFTGALSAADPAPAEATDAAAAAPQVVQADVTVKEVSGRAAQFRTGPDAPWQKLTTDSKLGVGSEVRTLPGTTVALQIGPNNLVTLKGVGVLAIADLSVDNDAKVINTLLAKKYGRMKAEVSYIGDFRNNTKVATPGQVMAVKGTTFGHTGFGSNNSVVGNEGSVQVNGKHNVGAGDESNTNNPDPNKNADNKNNLDKTSVPGSDGSNSAGNDANNGFAGNGGGEAKGTGDAYNSWSQSVRTFDGMIPRDKGDDDHGGPKF